MTGKLFAFASFFIVIIALSSCSTSASLIAVPDQYNATYVSGDSTYSAKAENGLQVVVETADFTGHEVEFNVSIANLTDQVYNFDDSDIELYQGNMETNDWSLVSAWNSSDYIKRIGRESRRRKLGYSVLGTLLIVDAVLNPDSEYTYFLDAGLFRYGQYSDVGYYAHGVFSSDDPIFNIAAVSLATIETSMAIRQMEELYLSSTTESLFTSTAIAPSSIASGMVGFELDKRVPDYKLVVKNKRHEDMEFEFSRSDRLEVLDPWAERNYTMMSLMYRGNVTLDRHNLELSFIEPSILGFYVGYSFYTGDSNPRDCGVDLGTSLKINPYTWLRAGAELTLMDDEEDLDLMPELGLQMSTYFLSMYVGGLYSIKDNRFYLDLGAGFAF